MEIRCQKFSRTTSLHFLPFQTAKSEDQTKLNTVYDNCEISSAQVLLNNDRYPLNSFEIDLTDNHFDVAYPNFTS